MDDEVKERLDQLQKRLEDFKWYVGSIAGLVILMFGLVAGIFGARAFFDAQAARSELRESKNELKEELLGLTGKPKIELQVNPEVMATVKGGTVKFPYIIKNSGASNSGALFAKLYTSQTLDLGNPSADDPNYKYEAYLTSDEIRPNPLPANVSVLNYYWFTPNNTPVPGKHPVKLKFFYGKDQMTEATFQLVIPVAEQKPANQPL